MKKTYKAYITRSVIIALVSIFGFMMAGCSQLGDDPPLEDMEGSGTPITPTASDYTITGTGTIPYDGNPKEVTITPKEDKSQGAITVYYEGISPTEYSKSTEAPSAVGKYTVSFDVAAATGFNAKTGLIAGTLNIKAVLVINDPKIKLDFEGAEWGVSASGYGERQVSSLGYGWTVSGVTQPATADDRDRKEGFRSIRLRGQTGDNCRVELNSYLYGIKSIYFDYASYGGHTGGTISVYYQIQGGGWVKVDDEITVPSWNEDDGMLNAKFDIDQTNVRFKIVREGNLGSQSVTSVNIDNIIITANTENDLKVVPVDPTAFDYNISGLDAIWDGNSKAVSITPKTGRGEVTAVYYEGTDGTSYAKSEVAPSGAGKYAVTFDVAAAEGFNAKNGLIAGTLVITEITDPFFIVDFEDEAWKDVPYTGKDVAWGGYNWRAVGYSAMTSGSDRYDGTRSLRLRGSNANDTVVAAGDQTNRLELMDFLPGGIKSITFDYGSYAAHTDGVIVLSYRKEGDVEWTEIGRLSAITWISAGNTWSKAVFNNINVTGKVRFKIEKPHNSTLGVTATNNSVNIDNIVVTLYSE